MRSRRAVRIALITASLAACVNARATDSTESVTDSTVTVPDTTVTVPDTSKQVPVSLTIAPRDTSVEQGATVRYQAVALDASGRGTPTTLLRWVSRDPATVVVDSAGVARAVAPGWTHVVVSQGQLADSAVATVVAPEPQADVTIRVSTAQRTPISRFVYGMNLTGDVGGIYEGGFPWYGARPPAAVTLDRFGGNRFSAYNWENNYSHAGVDYLHNNDEFLSSSRTPAAAVISRVTAARQRGAATLVTVPMIGYVAADGAGPVDTLDVTRSTRLATRFRTSVPNKPTALSTSPNTSDATVYQDEFVFALTRAFPGSTGDAVAPMMFSLDNEPDAWHATHKAILGDSLDNPARPRVQTYEGFLATSLAYATAIKRVAPDAIVFGPAVATFAGVMTIGRYPHPDPQHGTRSFVEFYLERVAQAERAAGRRLIDVLDLHWYPATGTNRGEITNDYALQDAEMVNARLQAPRSLWDPTFDEQSWVSDVTNGPVRLLPRLRAIINQYNPGMKIAVTEYYYGRGGDISGGIVQADVLGIFGRDGVFAATLWPQVGVWAQPYVGNGARAYAYLFGAFNSYLDYDGRGSRFGDIGLSTSVSDPVTTSAYSSIDGSGRVVMVLINKTASAQRAAVILSHPTPLTVGKAFVMRDGVPTPRSDRSYALSGNRAVIDLPPRSVTTLQIAP